MNCGITQKKSWALEICNHEQAITMEIWKVCEACHDLTSAESIIWSLLLPLIHVYLRFCVDVLYTIKWFRKLVNSWRQEEDWRTIELCRKLSEASSHLDGISLSCKSTVGSIVIIFVDSIEDLFVYFTNHVHFTGLIINNESVTCLSLSYRYSFNRNQSLSSFILKSAIKLLPIFIACVIW
jgi:hypothetical protein